MHRKDSTIYLVVTSRIHKSCLLQSTKISDYAIKKAENEKFRKDTKSSGPVPFSSTMRFIPVAINHVGLRGNYFNAALRKFAHYLVMRPSDCSLMTGSFTLSLP